ATDARISEGLSGHCVAYIRRGRRCAALTNRPLKLKPAASAMSRTSWLTVFVFFAALAVLTASLARAQSASVTGTVTDAEDGLPLIGANVVLYESDGVSMVGGAATDANGRYEITGIEPSAYVLAFQFL